MHRRLMVQYQSKGDRLIALQEIVKTGYSNVDSGSTLLHSDVE